MIPRFFAGNRLSSPGSGGKLVALSVNCFAVHLCLLLFCLFLATGSQAQSGDKPQLTEISGSELPNTFQTGKRYTIRLRYTDPNGDPVLKSKALFYDQSSAGLISPSATTIAGDPKTGVTVEWTINGFAAGSHQAYFQVETDAGITRFPADDQEFYRFNVEDLTTKIILMVVGLVIGLAAVPFLVYVLSRAMNPRGDPSGAARIGLLFGILSCCALFIYLFLSLYGPLVYAILIIGIFASLVLLIRRR